MFFAFAAPEAMFSILACPASTPQQDLTILTVRACKGLSLSATGASLSGRSEKQVGLAGTESFACPGAFGCYREQLLDTDPLHHGNLALNRRSRQRATDRFENGRVPVADHRDSYRSMDWFFAGKTAWSQSPPRSLFSFWAILFGLGTSTPSGSNSGAWASMA